MKLFAVLSVVFAMATIQNVFSSDDFENANLYVCDSVETGTYPIIRVSAVARTIDDLFDVQITRVSEDGVISEYNYSSSKVVVPDHSSLFFGSSDMTFKITPSQDRVSTAVLNFFIRGNFEKYINLKCKY